MCAAGGGKTTSIVGEAAGGAERALLVTYTRNNEKEIERKLYGLGPVIPPHLEVMTWFSFLLRDLARPYRSVMHDRRIDGLKWEEGRSVPYIPETNISAHYFAGGRLIYSDKISKFICECDRRTNGAPMRRLAQRFDHIFVDEIQDMAGYDLDVIELILKAGIKLTLVGDHRQATLKTNQGKKNAAFGGIKIIEKFKAWNEAGLATLSYQQHTHRCHQHIADLGDRFFPDEPATTSLNGVVTGQDGVFIVATAKVNAYVAAFAPQVLRFDKKTVCRDLQAMNFGESKGLTFDRVMIFPHGLAQKWLSTGQISHVEKSVARMYVGATRARHSLAFVYDGVVAIPDVQVYE
jgi:DNA helicase-2/ATP-dependent DNA helicase PcrA